MAGIEGPEPKDIKAKAADVADSSEQSEQKNPLADEWLRSAGTSARSTDNQEAATLAAAGKKLETSDNPLAQQLGESLEKIAQKLDYLSKTFPLEWAQDKPSVMGPQSGNFDVTHFSPTDAETLLKNLKNNIS